jgi:hypothetical protein
MKSANDYNMSMFHFARLDSIHLVARRSMFIWRRIIGADWHVKCLQGSFDGRVGRRAGTRMPITHLIISS